MNYQAIPSRETIDKLFENLRQRNFIPHFAASKEDALAKVISVIPAGSEIATDSKELLAAVKNVKKWISLRWKCTWFG